MPPFEGCFIVPVTRMRMQIIPWLRSLLCRCPLDGIHSVGFVRGDYTVTVHTDTAFGPFAIILCVRVEARTSRPRSRTRQVLPSGFRAPQVRNPSAGLAPQAPFRKFWGFLGLAIVLGIVLGASAISPPAACSDAPMGRPERHTADVGPGWNCQGRAPPAPQHRAPGRNTGCASLPRCSAGWRTVTESALLTFS